MNWTCPKRLVLGQNDLDGPKSFWTHRRTRHNVSNLIQFNPIFKNFRVSSTNRNMDSMPGTPATLSSYYDPASPNPSVSSINERPPCTRGSKLSRSNSLGGAAKMDLELHGSGGNSNNSDDIDGGSAVTKIVPNL